MTADGSSEPSSPKAVQHKRHDVYSESKPIPSIQRFFKRGLAEVIHHDEDSEEESSDDNQSLHKGTEEKPRANEERDSGKTKRGKTRIVQDPITKTRVAIHDIGRREYNRAMQKADDGSHSPKENGRTSTSSREKRKSKDDGERERKSGSYSHPVAQNVLNLPFPPEMSLPTQPWNIHHLLLPLFALWSILTILRLIHPIISVVSMAWMGWWSFQTVIAGVVDNRWERERLRGEGARKGYYNDTKKSKEEKYGELRPMDGVMEGAEWLNSILEALWSVLNSELFSSLGSTLEDVLQASTHGQAFIQAVKVEDLAQGSTPLRLTGLRILGDEEAYELRQEAQKEMKHRQDIEKKVKLPHEDDCVGLPTQDDERRAKEKCKPKAESPEQAGGSFINVELSFVYRARPTTNTVASKSRNAHLLIKFWVGARKWYHVPIPVWVEVQGFVGKVRARIQLTPDPPFIKNVTFAFMGLPKTEVSVIPLRINTQNIPFLSGFIQKSIDAAVGEYCAPSSLTIDVGEMLMGDNIKREVNALGVLLIVIHRAFDLEKQDVTGSSDPYCTISLRKNGKVQYCTRVALDDLSPRWEERCFIIVTPEAVRAKEKVLISLWDSDRLSADDILGQAEVDLQALVRRPGRLFRRTDTLVGLTKEMKKQGTVQWSVGYFSKTPNKRRWTDDDAKQKEEQGAERIERQDEDAVDVKESDVERDMHTLDHEEDLQDLQLPEDDPRQTRNTEQAVSFEPPSPTMPSGILALQIHQIADLEMVDTCTHISSRSSADTAQKVETMEDQQDSPRAPSPYVTIVLNDETIFRSRAKALNSNPFFNAGTERHITDWTRTLVMFVIWDSRLREEDAILGVVPMKLLDVFKHSSQVTQFFPIAGGVGQGRIRLSLLFRPLQGTIKRREKLGWSIGTMRVHSSLTATHFEQHYHSMSLRLVSVRFSTLAGKASISPRRCSLTNKGDGQKVEWHLNKEELPLKIPVRRRYASPFMIEFRAMTPLGTRKTTAMCIVWMQDLSDDDINEEKLPIWQPKYGHDFHRLIQNYHNFRNEEEAERLGVERVGYLYISLQFKSGAGQAHVKFVKRNPDVKQVMDAWACCTAAGLRNVRGDFVEKNDEDNDKDSIRLDHEDDDNDDSEEEEHDEEEEKNKKKELADQDDDELGFFEKLRKWSDEKKELHRQHRGIKQYKVARTASWLGKGVRDSGTRAVNSLRLQDRRSGQVESEI